MRALSFPPHTRPGAAEPSPLYAQGAPGSPSRVPAPLTAPSAAHATPGYVSDGRASFLGFGSSTAHCVIWDTAGGRLIYAADHIILLEDLQTHSQQLLQHHAQPVGTLALSCDGRLLASAAAQPADPQHGGIAEVCVWDLASRRMLRVLRQHGGGVRHLAFAPDGAWLASVGAGAGAGLVLWDLEEGEAVALGRTDGVSDACWVKGLHAPMYNLLQSSCHARTQRPTKNTPQP